MRDYTVDRKKWAALSLFNQMGNIGSEVGRSFKSQQKGDKPAAEAAVVRALDLFDATAEAWLKASSFARLKELLQAKEEFLSAYENGDDNGIENYFTQFAIAARLRQGYDG